MGAFLRSAWQSGNRGFSLVEVVITSAILGVLVLAGVEIVKLRDQIQKNFYWTQALNEARGTIRFALSKSEGCKPNIDRLDTKTFSFAPAILKDVALQFSKIQSPAPASQDLVVAGAELAPGLTLNSLDLKDFVEIFPGSRYMARLSLSVTKTVGGFSRTSVVGSIPLVLQTGNNAGTNTTILDCWGGEPTLGSVQLVPATPADQPGGWGQPSNTTGDQACANQGKTCVHVLSFNYLRGALGLWDHAGSHCSSIYNYLALDPHERIESLPFFTTDYGVASPVTYGLPPPNLATPHGNTHSCSTKVGVFTTSRDLLLSFGGCCAEFVAVCQ